MWNYNKHCRTLMVQGTGSDVGKSIIVAGLCRLFKSMGFKVTPFKAQNMSLNSYVTKDSLEMGRAQATQAFAACVEPDVRMNPILLKPNSDTGSQVVAMGKPLLNIEASEYYNRNTNLKEIVKDAFISLANDFELIIIEGAGSSAEINLKEKEFVNMFIAKNTNSPVILVGDIDKGGVFAQLLGSWELFDDEERNLVKAFMINKFRGDKSLLKSGLELLTERTNVPVLGVLDYIKELYLPEEDALAKEYYSRLKQNDEGLKIGIVALPHMSNMTDFDPLLYSGAVSVSLIKNINDFNGCDCVIIPGSKNTIGDLTYLKEKNFHKKIIELASEGKQIVGICGGFQMLGKQIIDPHKLESNLTEIEGLGLLDIKTEISPTKETVQTTAYQEKYKIKISGYEIHHGKTYSKEKSLLKSGNNIIDAVNGNIWGTYLHGVFDNKNFTVEFLKELKEQCSKELNENILLPDFDIEIEKVVKQIKKDLNLNKILDIIGI